MMDTRSFAMMRFSRCGRDRVDWCSSSDVLLTKTFCQHDVWDLMDHENHARFTYWHPQKARAEDAPILLGPLRQQVVALVHHRFHVTSDQLPRSWSRQGAQRTKSSYYLDYARQHHAAACCRRGNDCVLAHNGSSWNSHRELLITHSEVMYHSFSSACLQAAAVGLSTHR